MKIQKNNMCGGKTMSEEKINYFEEEMKALLAGYISNQDTVEYLVLKASKLHEKYSEK